MKESMIIITDIKITEPICQQDWVIAKTPDNRLGVREDWADGSGRPDVAIFTSETIKPIRFCTFGRYGEIYEKTIGWSEKVGEAIGIPMKVFRKAEEQLAQKIMP